MSKENYKPTRTEWLALSMQAWIPMLLSQMRRLYPTEGVDDVRVFFRAKGLHAVGIAVRHVKTVPQPVIEYLQAEIGREVKEFVESHAWEGEIALEWDVR